MGTELFHADGRMDGPTDRQTDMTRLIVAFRSFENAPDKTKQYLVYINKCPTSCNNMQSIFYFTAMSLYMFRVPSTPIIRST